MKFYGSSRDKLSRLGLAEVLLDLQQIILGAAVEGEQISRMPNAHALSKRQPVACPCIRVISLLSTRKERLISRVLRLRNDLQSGALDVGVLIVPSERMTIPLRDRTPSLSDVVEVFELVLPEAGKVPIVLIAIEQDRVATLSADIAFRDLGIALSTYAKRH